MQFKVDSFAKLLGPELAEKLDIEDVEEEAGEMINPGAGAAKSEKPQPKVIDDDVEGSCVGRGGSHPASFFRGQVPAERSKTYLEVSRHFPKHPRPSREHPDVVGEEQVVDPECIGSRRSIAPTSMVDRPLSDQRCQAIV